MEEEEEEREEGGGEMFLVYNFGGERNALILKLNDEGGEAARSYSSMRLARSSSEVMETRASRSSLGNWQRKLTQTDVPHSCPNLNNSSVPYHVLQLLQLEYRIQSTEHRTRIQRNEAVTSKGNGAANGKKAGFATVVAEFAVGIAREDLAAVAAEELEGESVAVEGRSAHVSAIGIGYWILDYQMTIRYGEGEIPLICFGLPNPGNIHPSPPYL